MRTAVRSKDWKNIGLLEAKGPLHKHCKNVSINRSFSSAALTKKELLAKLYDVKYPSLYIPQEPQNLNANILTNNHQHIYQAPGTSA